MAAGARAGYTGAVMTKKDSFADLFEREPRADVPAQRDVQVGDRLEGTVVQVGTDNTFIELDAKRQAFFHTAELLDREGQPTVKVGDTLEATVVEIDRSSGEIRLGRAMGGAADLGAVQDAHDRGVPVEGKVTGTNKGGLEVDLGGVSAFCPISQADRGFVQDPTEMVGKSFHFVVTEIREGGRSVVVSRRRVLEEQAEQAADKALSKLSPGMILKGTVTNVRDFGVFVDLGGVEGLVPASELSHDRGSRPADMVKAGEVVEVQVQRIEQVEPTRPGQPRVRITLSLKALAADPWEALDTVAPVGRVVQGTVTRMKEFGAFIRLASGVEGLLHVSELSGKPEHPSKVLTEGQSITVVVKSTDAAKRRISLVPAPDELPVGAAAPNTRVALGAVVKGIVERHEPYGVFVQLAGTQGRAGRGLIPNEELGISRGADKRKELPLGTEVTAKVLETGEGRLRLSVSAAIADHERAEFDGWREQEAAQGSLGTFGDLLKKKLS